MNLMDLFVKIGVDDQASGAISKITGGIGKGLATAAKVGTAAIGAAAAGITALTKASVAQYAEYEQLVGGVDTLFKGASDKVQQYAANAYKTAGLSANDYMNTVTSFSASLIQSLGGDTEKAAEYADVAITDMADNANKMGTDIAMLQTTYAGFAKQNFTMLDNLKLGYGGTKEEMARLLKDAEKISGVKYDISSFADITQAIHVMQEEMGIAGATAQEASSTISGSIGMMKGAWQNLVVGITDPNADFGLLIENMVDSAETAFGNLMPAIEEALHGISALIFRLAPIIVDKLPGLLDSIIPPLISGATDMVDAVVDVLPDLLETVTSALVESAPLLIESGLNLIMSLITAIQENYQILTDAAMGVVTQLANGMLTMLPSIISLGLQILISLANGIALNLPTLIPTIVSVILQIVNTLTNPETLTNLLNAAMAIIQALAENLLQPDVINSLIQAAVDIVSNLVTFLMENLGPLLDAAIEIIMALVDYLLDPENLKSLIEMAVELVVTIAGGLIGAVGELIKAVGKLIKNVIKTFKETDWGALGKNIVEGLKKGISNAWKNLKKWFKNLFGDLIGIAKKILGIKSPSRVFRSIGAFTAEGFGIGFDDEFANVKDNIENAMAFDDVEIGANIHKSGSYGGVGAVGGTSFGDVIIQIDGARYNDEQSLAAAIAERLQNMTDRKAAVYA